MPRSALMRHRNRDIFLRTSPEGGGGSGTPNQQTGTDSGASGGNLQQTDQPKPDATDEFGQSLGFPKDTAVKDMKPEQQAAYWRTESKKQQKKAEDAERKLQQQQSTQTTQTSATVTDQQQGQGQSTAAVDEVKVRREAASQAALATLEASLALRGKNSDERAEILDLVDTTKFLTDDGKIDAAKVTRFVDREAPASTGNGSGGSGGTPGQGRFQHSGASKREQGEAEAQRRFAGQKDQPNRGALGGLRR